MMVRDVQNANQNEYHTLELALDAYGDDRYRIRLSTQVTGSTVPQEGQAVVVPRSTFAQLPDPRLKTDAYATQLTAAVFGDEATRTTFAQSLAVAQAAGKPLRVQVALDPAVDELHRIVWELLHNPQTNVPLATSEQIIFSRYLGSRDWRTVQPAPPADQRLLAVVANPTDITTYAPGGTRLAAFDTQAELAWLTELAGTLPTTPLTASDATTLDGIIQHLRDGATMLYLLAHGSLHDGQPHLWLSKPDGQAGATDVAHLIEVVQGLPRAPVLVVLASCASAGNGTGAVLQALGPQLVAAGVPAVLAMQGNITIATVAAMMSVLFRELLKDGQLDRAVAVARSRVRSRDDWWMPALFLRARDGRVLDVGTAAGERMAALPATPPHPSTPTEETPTPSEAWEWLKIMGFTRVDKEQYAIIFHTHRVPNPRQTSADFFVDEFLYKCSLYNDGKVLKSVKLNDLHSTSLMNGLIFAAPATGKTVHAQALKRMLSKQICIYEVRNLQGRDNNVTNWEDQITRTINADLYIKGDNNRFSERFFSDLQQEGYSRIVIIADPFRSNSLGNHADSRQHLEALLSICQEQDNVQGFFFLPDSYREVLENFLEDTAHFDLYCIRLDNTRPHESFRRILDKRFGYYLGSGNLPGSGEVAAATGVPTQKLFGDTVDNALEEIARASKGSIRKMLRLTRDILEAHVEQLNNESSEKWQAPIPLDTVERVCSQWH